MSLSSSPRRVRTLMASAVALAAAGLAQAAPPTYRVTDLGMPDGHIFMRGSALSDRGEVIGISFGKGKGAQFYTWTEATGRKSWGEPFKHPGVALADLNRRHQVVGDIYHDVSSRQTGFVWAPSTGTQPIEGLIDGHVNSGMAAVNDLGVATGWYTSDASPHTHSFVWSADAGWTDIHPRGYYSSGPVALNNRGQVLAWAYRTLRTEQEPLVLTRGAGVTHLECPPLAGEQGSACFGSAINDRGQIAGEVRATMGTDSRSGWPRHVVVWSPEGVPRDIQVGSAFEDYKGDFADINQPGQVVGRMRPTDASPYETFYWDVENGMHRLEDLVDPADPLKGRFEATGERPKINSQGVILLNASFDHNASHQHALVLTPVR